MNVKRVALLGAITTLVIAVGMRDASAQSPQSGYYGYPSAQAPSAQNPATACQPSPPGCQVEYVGCHVAICPCPCTTGDACERIKKLIPPIRPAPSCQEVQPCVIDDELPPSAQVSTVTIYRNCYVPLRIKRVQSPSTVNAVNIQVNWREVHYLCGEDGKPLSSQQSAEVLKQLQTQLANGIDVAPGGPAAPTPSSTQPAGVPGNESVGAPPAVSQASTPNAAPAAPSSPVTSASATPAAAQNTPTAAPAKTWVWLASEGVYGYGYQRADGYWEIDAGSRRASLN